MATPRKRKRYTPQQRQEFLERFARSGLKQAEFCRQAKLHPMTFSLWRRRLKPTRAVFAEVQVTQVSTPSLVFASDVRLGGAAVLYLRDGARLEVALGGEATWTGLGLMLKKFQA